jgi:SAM-dependent methyltransferase
MVGLMEINGGRVDCLAARPGIVDETDFRGLVWLYCRIAGEIVAVSKDETEYTDEFAAGLELIWGEGFLSPGGPEEVGPILRGVDLGGKEVLDIGSGLGGPSLCLASRHGAGRVVGIDLEPLNVARATAYAATDSQPGRVTFQAVDGGNLPFTGLSISSSARMPSPRPLTRRRSSWKHTASFARVAGSP